MRWFGVAAALLGATAVPVAAQSTLDRPLGAPVPFVSDSGVLANPAAAAAVVHTQVVHSDQASWLRLYFGEGLELGPGSELRITSLLDGQVQVLDASALARWGNTSAYFNGDTVLVELVAGPATARNRLVIEQLADGNGPQPVGDPGECGICGVDERVQSSENWSSRLLPAGCTASVWNQQSCMVSAGHCIGGTMVVEFNVPDSTAVCGLNHPIVADQFPIVATDSVNGGVGNDWSVLQPGVNSIGQLPYERYGQLRPIAAAPASTGQSAAMWGFGVNTFCPWSQTQQTSDGMITFVGSSHYEFDIDLRGGNSGSALMHDDEIIGIVTHCSVGCPNFGTRVDLASFAQARDELCGLTLAFSFPNGVPELVTPGQTLIIPVVVSADGAIPQPGTGQLHLSINGGPFVSLGMSESAPNEYEAFLPAFDCADVVDFYFSALTTTGDPFTSPSAAPAEVYSAAAALGLATVFSDDFEADQGWTVTNVGLSDGPWERADPVSNGVCNRGNPGFDADGSGQCFVTDNDLTSCNSDVDGGSTTLTSPILDASGGETLVSYWRWFSNTGNGQGDNPFQDIFVVEVSDDGGATWVNLETVGPTGPEADGGWFRRSFPIQQFVALTDQFRIRFIAADAEPGSIVEAGVDGVELVAVDCGSECPWDVDDDGQVGVTDLLTLLGVWGTDPGGPPDFDGDGSVGVTDLLELLANWGSCL